MKTIAFPMQGFGSGISLPPNREDVRAEIFTPPDLQNLGAKGRPAIVDVGGLAPPLVLKIAMGRWVAAGGGLMSCCQPQLPQRS